MPGFNGTGPDGVGPMTGGGRGYCITPLTDAHNSNQVAKSSDSPATNERLYGRRKLYSGVSGRGRRRGFAHRR